jgi:flagellar protein FlaG
MPTEITTEMRQSMSRVADTSRVQQQKAVIEADRTVARQGLSVNEQSVPSAKESSQPSSQQLEKAATSLNKHVQSLKRDLHFSVDDDTGETIIRVVDSESQRMIRTIPSDEFISMSQQLNQTVGMLLNAKA